MKDKLEFRYYEIPEKEQLLALLGESWKRPFGLDYLHFHNYMEVGVCHYGEGEAVIEDRHYPFRDTAITVIPPNIPHDHRTTGERSFWEWLYIDVENVLGEMYPNDEILARKVRGEIYGNAFCVKRDEQPVLAQLLDSIIKEAEEKKYLYRESIKGLLRSFVVELLRINQCDKDLKRIEQNTLLIASAIDYVERRYAEDVKISDMAQACSISESHFRKLFGECMGVHPLEFLNLIRIQKACELMTKTDHSIESISYESGFGNVSTFIRNFRKVLGMTPYQWKKSSGNYEGKPLNFRIKAKKGW